MNQGALAPNVVLIALDAFSHRVRLMPIAAEIVRQGANLIVVDSTESALFWGDVGASVVDLFADGTIEDADPWTIPWAARRITFAAMFGKQLARRLAPLRPSLIVHDQFAVVGWVVANELNLPRVTLCGRSAFCTEREWAPIAQRGLLHIADECHRAVDTLRSWGMPNASPFSFVTLHSDDLNVYAEPAQYLNEAERAMLDPVVCSGSVNLDGRTPPNPALIFPVPTPAPTRQMTRLYVAFGTVMLQYWADEAIGIIRSVAEATEANPQLTALVSLGGADLAGKVSDLASSRFRVVDFVDQWQVLTEADVFLTHHGMKSTHEAIYHGVPMIGCPFHADQPQVSARCAEMGMSVPLVDDWDYERSADDVLAALAAVEDQRLEMADRFAEARQWELVAIAARPAIVRRMRDMAS